MKLGIRQFVISAGVFAMLLTVLVSFDDRVRERFGDLISGAGSVSSLNDRAGMFVDALSTAVRYQSLENAPLMVFATVGAVLMVFMLRS